MNKLIGLFGLFFLAISLVSLASAQIIVRTELDSNTLVADGKTEYVVRVWADVTQHPEFKVVGVEWDVVLPNELWDDKIVVTGAYLPESNDFFEGWEMFSGWNRVDGTPNSNGELTDNARLTDDPFDGPSGAEGYIGEYHFKIMPGYLGTASFDLNDIEFVDQDINQYRSDNGWVEIQNEEFTVVAKKSINPFGEAISKIASQISRFGG